MNMSAQRELDGGRYVLDDEPIASGGMGTVWRGYDQKLKRAVAIKELRLSEGLSESEREIQQSRVMVEARAAARLDHPGIVSVYDVIEDDGRPWIVMRLVSGRSLAQEVEASGALSPRRAAEIGLQVLDALAAAHAEGILHRDVKPQNVLLDTDGKAVLGDFGIAVVTGVTRPVTEAGLVVGTLGYVAPERLSGGKAEPESDLWSLGATLYFAVEGRKAYDTGDVVTTIAAVVTREPEPMRLAGPLLPVIAGLMVRDVDERLTAPAAEKLLRSVLSGRPPRADATKILPGPPGKEHTAPRRPDVPPAAAPEQPPRKRRRIWATALGTAAVSLVIGVAAGMLLTGGDDSDASSKKTATNQFTSAPDICHSDLLNEARVKEFLYDPKPVSIVDTDSVVRCEWESEEHYGVLSVRIIAHKSTEAATALLEDKMPSDESDASSPDLGDQAYGDLAGDNSRAWIRVSNLTIEIHYNQPRIFGKETVEPLAREIVASVEAEAG